MGVLVGPFEAQDAENGAVVVAKMQGVGLLIGRAGIQVAVMEHEIPAPAFEVVKFFGVGGPGFHMRADEEISQLPDASGEASDFAWIQRGRLAIC